MSKQTTRAPKPLYQIIASTVDAYHRCCEKGNHQWEGKHLERLEHIDDLLPSGSGIDCGTKIDIEASTGIVFKLTLSYHHMDEHGGYDGWTEHTIRVTGSMIQGILLTISGEDRNDIKEYLHQVYDHALSEKYEEGYDEENEAVTMKLVPEKGPQLQRFGEVAWNVYDVLGQEHGDDPKPLGELGLTVRDAERVLQGCQKQLQEVAVTQGWEIIDSEIMTYLQENNIELYKCLYEGDCQ